MHPRIKNKDVNTEPRNPTYGYRWLTITVLFLSYLRKLFKTDTVQLGCTVYWTRTIT